jgi:hypothetical protein
MPKIDTTVGNLVEMIRNGELRLPEMQRRYVWPATRVRDLLDSLYRGYPSGTILVWETDREMPIRDLAVSQDESPFKGHKMLLDGQQRLTSLSAILRAEPVKVRGKKRPIEILFNLDHPDGAPAELIEVEGDSAETEEPELDEETDSPSLHQRLKLRAFVVSSKVLLADPHWVRVSDIFSGNKTDAQMLKPLVSSFDDPLFDKFSKRLQAVRKIRDYPYVMHVLDKELSYEEVAEIFVRVNSLGIKLRGSDLALAQITSRWPGSLKLFEDFQEECEDKWFTLDLGLLVRALVVFTTSQSRFKTVGSISLRSLKAGWDAAKDGIRYSVNFLSANTGVEDESLLSSPMLLIVPGFYASRKGFKISSEEERGLKRWLFFANGRGHYSGASETTLDSDLNIITKGGSPADLIASLKVQLGRLETMPEDFIGRGKQNALFPTAYLALRAAGAKDWRTGLALSLTHQGRLHFIEHHHIFPKTLLKKAGYSTAEINQIANLAFVAGGTNRKLFTKPPDEYLPDIAESRGEKALEAHCIPLDRELWRLDAFPRFVEARRSALAKAINNFIADVQEKDPPIDVSSLLASGESERVEFKSSSRWDYREGKQNKTLELVVAKTIAGFLNTEAGGTLVLGAGDDGKVLGLDSDYKTLHQRPNRDGYQQFLVNLISTTMGKVACSSVKLEFVSCDGADVCIVHCAPSPRAVYVQDSQHAKFYLRTGNATQELSTKDSVEYVASRWR